MTYKQKISVPDTFITSTFITWRTRAFLWRMAKVIFFPIFFQNILQVDAEFL